MKTNMKNWLPNQYNSSDLLQVLNILRQGTSTCNLTKTFRLSLTLDLTLKFSMKDMVEFLSETQVVGRGKRQVIKPKENKNV